MEEHLRFPRDIHWVIILFGLDILSLAGIGSTATYKIFWGIILSVILFSTIGVILILVIKLDSIYMDSTGILWRKNKYLWDIFTKLQIKKIGRQAYKVVLYSDSGRIIIRNSISVLEYMLEYCKSNEVIINALKEVIL